MRRFMVVANWKMFGSLTTNEMLVQEILANRLWSHSDVQCVVCPPYVYLSQLQTLLKSSPLILGAQNVSELADGARTGDIAASMLAEFGCQYVLVGHSERRQHASESDEKILNKCLQAEQHHLKPILCVGETAAERAEGRTFDVIAKQLASVLPLFKVDSHVGVVIAYEPIWAIGAKTAAGPDEAQAVHHWIRQQVASLNSHAAQNLTILYGGSVQSNNAQALFAMPDIDGALVGRASLNADEFMGIISCITSL